MTTVGEIVAILDRYFPPRLAEEWDAPGLSVGDPTAPVERVLFAVDPVMAVADEAADWSATMLVTHHPLMLRGVTSVAANTAKGAVVHRLILSGCALYSAHTNADAASPGVADALAEAIGLTGTRPLVPDAAEPALGTGRVGVLASPTTLRQFAQAVADALPSTAPGVRVAGDLDALIRTVAVLGGSGGSLLDAVAAADVDAYVTADLRHHPASEARELAELTDGRPALVDVSHFASEWRWLAAAAERLAAEAGVVTRVSTLNTDPWTGRFGATAPDA
jgi:dinuclear metal center YbgI/SA1388 family protein